MTPKVNGMERAEYCEGAHPGLLCIRKRGASPPMYSGGPSAHRVGSWTLGKAVSTHFVEPDHATDTHCQPPTLGPLTQLLELDRNNAAPSTPMQLNTLNGRDSNPSLTSIFLEGPPTESADPFAFCG
jgi:hypothetical protein